MRSYDIIVLIVEQEVLKAHQSAAVESGTNLQGALRGLWTLKVFTTPARTEQE